MSDFIGFTFDGKHSSDFNIIRISENPFYSEPMYGDISDNTKTIIGHDGAFYINTTQSSRIRSLNLAFHNMSHKQYMAVQYWLRPNSGFKKLIFDESPQKYCMAKITSNPTIQLLPTGATETTNFITTNVNNFNYNGFLTIQILMTDIYSYATTTSLSSYSSMGDYENIWYNNSNILLTSQTPMVSTTNVTSSRYMSLYNAGNSYVLPDITLVGSGTNITVAEEVAENTFEGITIDEMDNETIRIENNEGQIVLVSTTDSLVTYRRTSGSHWLSLVPTVTISRYDSAVYTVGIGGVYEVTLPTTYSWDDDVVGKSLCINNKWYKIKTRVSSTIINLDTAVSLVDETTYTNLVVAFVNRIYISGDSGFNLSSVSFAYEYKYI